jgi:hypothetical protein
MPHSIPSPGRKRSAAEARLDAMPTAAVPTPGENAQPLAAPMTVAGTAWMASPEVTR